MFTIPKWVVYGIVLTTEFVPEARLLVDPTVSEAQDPFRGLLPGVVRMLVGKVSPARSSTLSQIYVHS